MQALCDEVPRSLPIDISSMVRARTEGPRWLRWLNPTACRVQDMGGSMQIRELEWPNNINLLLAGRPKQTLVKIVDRIG